MPPITNDLSGQFLNLFAGKGVANRETNNSMDDLAEKMDSVLDALKENAAVKVDKNGRQRITGLAGDGYNIDVVGAAEKSQKLKMQPLQKKLDRKKKEIEALKEFKQKIKDLQSFMDGSVGGGNADSVFAKKNAVTTNNEIALVKAKSYAETGTHTLDVKQLATEGNILSRKFSVETLNSSSLTGTIKIRKDGELLHSLDISRDSKTGMVIHEKIVDNSEVSLLQDSINNFFSKLNELEFFNVSKIKNDIDNTYVYSVKYSGQGNITFEDDQGGNVVNLIFDNSLSTTLQTEPYSNLVFDSAHLQSDEIIQTKGGINIEIYNDKNCTEISNIVSYGASANSQDGTIITYSKLIGILDERGYRCEQIEDVSANDGRTYLKVKKGDNEVFLKIKEEQGNFYSSNIITPKGKIDSNDKVTFGSVKLISLGDDFTVSLNKKYDSMEDLCNELNEKIHKQNPNVDAFIQKLNGSDCQQTIGFRRRFENGITMSVGVEYNATESDSFCDKSSSFYLNNSIFNKSYADDDELFLNNFSDFRFQIFSDPECKSRYGSVELKKSDFGATGKITFKKFIDKLSSFGATCNTFKDPNNPSKSYVDIKTSDNRPLFIGGRFSNGTYKNVSEISIKDNNPGPFSPPFNVNADQVFCKGFTITPASSSNVIIEFPDEVGRTLQGWCKYINEELPEDKSIDLPIKIKAKIDVDKLVFYSDEGVFSVGMMNASSSNRFVLSDTTQRDEFVPFVYPADISQSSLKSYDKTINKFNTEDIDDLYRGVISKAFDNRNTQLNLSGSFMIALDKDNKKTLTIENNDTLDQIAEKIKQLDENLNVLVRKTEVPVYPTPPDTAVKLVDKYVLQVSCKNKEDNISFYAVSSPADANPPNYKNSADLMVSLGLVDGTNTADPTYPSNVLSNTSDRVNNAFKIKDSNIISRALVEVSKPLICVVDNVLIENNSNTLNNNLYGISIECMKEGKTDINVVPDITAIYDNMKTFVHKYNDFIVFANQQLEKKKDVDDKGNPVIEAAEHAYLYSNDIFKESVKKIKSAVLAYQGSKKLSKENGNAVNKPITFLSEAGITVKMKDRFDDDDTYDLGTLVLDEDTLQEVLETKANEFINFMKIFMDLKGVELEDARGQFLTEFDTNELNVFLTKEGGKKVLKKFMKKYDFGNIAVMSNSISKTDKFDASKFTIKREAQEYNVDIQAYETKVRDCNISGNLTPEEFVTAFNNLAFCDTSTSKNNGSYAELEPDPYDDSKTRIVIYGGGHKATYRENEVDVERKTVNNVKYYIQSTNDSAVKGIFNDVTKSRNIYNFNHVFKCNSDCNVISGGSNVRISKYSSQKDLLGTKVVGVVFSVNDFAQFVNGKRILFKHNFTGTMLSALNDVYTSGVMKIASDTADKELKNIQESIGRKEENNAKELEVIKKKQADMDAIRAKANEAHTRLKAIIKSLHSDS